MFDTIFKSNQSRWLAYLSHLIVLAILLTLFFTPRPAHADWLPFKFRLLPSYENGKILYNIRFSSQVDWPITDLTLKFPLPPGTRFLEAQAEPSTQVSFDGAEITFFTASVNKRLRNAYFLVEVADPNKTTFATRPWIAWKGNVPGEYFTEETIVDTTLKPLNWQPPANSHVKLEAGATVADEIITYSIYPASMTSRRIWDLKVNVPIPDGAEFLTAEAPPTFVATFDGQEVSFSTLELPARTEVGPLSVRVSSQKIISPYISTKIKASWKNVGPNVAPQEDIQSGDLIIQPHAAQQLLSDMAGDVPFANYDLTNLVFTYNETQPEFIFYTAGELGPVGTPLEFAVYLDQDCRADTGSPRRSLGVEYRLRYRHKGGITYLHVWDEAKPSWSRIKSVEMTSRVQGNQVAISLPHNLLAQNQRFCWTADAKNRTTGFASRLPADAIPDKEGSEFLNPNWALDAGATKAPLAGSSPGSISN